MKTRDIGLTSPHNFGLGHERFLAEALTGLQKPRKELPSKYFYDERGSILFEHICALEEYYIPRTEASIMNTHVKDMAKLIGPNVLMVEYGCGNCEKARFLLDHLSHPVAYVPIDISLEQLSDVAEKLASDYPELQVLPVCADYMSNFELPVPNGSSGRVVVYFPGSTIGNFDPIPARHFLEYIAGVCGKGGALLIGVDLKKEPAVLHNAYNDKDGITALFNLNLLERINRELDCDFKLEWFRHYAFYNFWENRVEMHIVSQKEQTVHLNGISIPFTKGESIWTESSYKYNLDEFEQMAVAAGFRVEMVWTDEQQWFSIQYLVKT